MFNTKLRSIDIERFTPKFLKNWEPQLFQKLAGVGSRCLIPICNPMNANWYNTRRITKTIVFVIGVFFCGALAAQEDTTFLVAVLEPVGNAGVTTINKRSVRGTLEECVTKSKEYRAVDRARTNQILTRNSFQRNGMVDNNKVQDIGKMLNANFVFLSELFKENAHINISIALIDVETGVLAGARNKMMEGANPMTIQKLVGEMATDILGVESKRQRDKGR